MDENLEVDTSTVSRQGAARSAIVLFCGGGGADVGIENAVLNDGSTVRVTVAVNHDPVAIQIHAANFPHAKHLESDIWKERPWEHGPVDILWASPDCRHHSRAGGGAIRSEQVRELPFSVTYWAQQLRPAAIFMENVEEIQDWGPLLPDGRPDPARKGETYAQWVRSICALGYTFDARILSAHQYGVPTIRKRWYAVFRREGTGPIRWPEPTHGGAGQPPVRSAAEIIDWSIPGRSIFGRKSDLAPETQKRIARGLRRFVVEAAKPHLRICTEPVEGLPEPDMVASWLMKFYGGVTGTPLDKPVGTITTQDHHAVVEHVFGAHAPESLLVANWLEMFYGNSGGASLANPTPTVTAHSNHIALASAFFVLYHENGTNIWPLERPVPTITATAGIALVLCYHGRNYFLRDIRFRMLTPEELRRAQGLDLNINPDGKRTVAQQIRIVGNSVVPMMAQKIIEAQIW